MSKREGHPLGLSPLTWEQSLSGAETAEASLTSPNGLLQIGFGGTLVPFENVRDSQ